jgi:hypothetical protein
LPLFNLFGFINQFNYLMDNLVIDKRNFMKYLGITLALLTALTGCGGGGGSSASATGATSISGIASAGAPITGATITLLSSNGLFYATTATTDGDGKFQLNVDSATYTAPYLLKITKSSGQSVGSYYAYVSSNNASGLLVTPISNATLGLASNANLDQIFESGTIPSNLNSTNIDGALAKIYAATTNVFNALSITDKSLLLTNSSYFANGEGQDSALDALNFNSASATDGSVLVGSKLTGTSVKIDSSSSAGSINAIPFSGNGTTLLGSINSAVNQVNQCIKASINNNTISPSCLDDQYLGSGIDKSNFVTQWRSDVSELKSVGLSSVRWCIFDNAALSFNSTSTQLANATGICNASFAVTAKDGAGVISEDYKFTLSSSGNSVSSVKAYGNQVIDYFQIAPKIKTKLRVDGFTTNTGSTSGYMFDIGTALQKANGNPTILATSNISAKVEILDAVGSAIDTFYMQCQQGSNCIDSNLAVCKNKSPTCADGTDKVADNIISVNSSLGNSIITALQQGFVQARVTAYNKILSDNTKQQRFIKMQPIVGLPVGQEVVDQLTFPSLTTASANALASWTGQDAITLTLNRGESRIALLDMTFVVQPSAAVDSKSATIKRGATSISYTGLTSGNGSQIVPLTTSGCQTAQSAGAANWRGVFISGTFANIPVEIKQFGSCYQDNY